jgi:predicted ribonuclease toxin of YeeF-YezG toxin-antitoxin module
MANQLELLQKQNQALRQTLAARDNLLKQASKSLLELQDALNEEQAKRLEIMDNFFALLHTFGPEITIKIDNFFDVMENAQFAIKADMVDGNFITILKFYPDGIPQEQQPEQHNGQ